MIIKVEEHMGLIPRIATKYEKSIGYEDAFQLGCEGLIKAANNYDETKGAFSTIATFCIENTIKNYLRDRVGLVKIPRSMKLESIELRKMLENGDTLEQISERVGKTVVEINNILNSLEPISSLDYVVYAKESKSITLGDMADKAESFEEDVVQDLSLKQAIDSLKPIERKVIKHRYFDNMLQKEIGEMVGLSQRQISVYERQGLKKLRKSLAIC